MNSHQNKSHKRWVLASVVGSLLLTAGAANAATSNGKLTLSVYLDTPGAFSVLWGHYDAAIKQLQGRTANYGSEYTTTNLCVALIMTKRFDEARPACDDAIQRAKGIMPSNVFRATANDRTLLALAYSNRAVLSWLRKQPEDAADDVVRAHDLAPHADFVAANWLVYSTRKDLGESPAIALNGR
jgi:hypothetical protein